MKRNNRLLVPSKIDIVAILKHKGYSWEYIRKRQDKYNYFIHLIVRIQALSFSSDDYNGFSVINYATLRSKHLKRQTEEIIRNLIEWGIVICDGIFLPKKFAEEQGKEPKSYGYAIAPAYNSKVVPRTVCEEDFSANIEKLCNVELPENKAAQYIFRQLKQTGIHKAVFKYIDTKLQRSVEHLEKSDFISYIANQETLNLYEFKDDVEGTLQELTSVLFNHYNADMITATSIYNEEYYVTMGKKEGNITGRLFHNVCSLSRDLRKFLYHKRHRGEELVNLDIRNSQPLFLNILLKQAYKDKMIPADVQHYIDLTSKGLFYEFLMDILGVPREKRRNFKITMFGKIFYRTTHYSIRQVEGKLFRSLFPNVAAFIEAKKDDRDRGHKALALEMQKAEADIIIGQVVKELQRRRKFVLTIHDSTVVQKKDAEEALALMKTIFKEKVLLEPTINIESLSPALTESIELSVAA